MDIKLRNHQIFCPLLPEGSEESLIASIHHPFVRPASCAACRRLPCRCGASPVRGLYTCSLCQRSEMDLEVTKHHLREPSHKERMASARNKQVELRDVMRHWNEIYDTDRFKRLKQEDCTSLPDEVLAAVHRFIRASPTRTDRSLLQEAVNVLEKYERLERLSLLHLAVWKSECLLQMPVVVHSFLTAQQWSTEGWKGCKTTQRESPAMMIIVGLVQSFL